MDYNRRIIELSESIQQEESRIEEIRRIARREADGRIGFYLWCGLFIWSGVEFGWLGVIAAFAGGFVVLYLRVRADADDPRTEQHLIIRQAEIEVLLRGITEARDSGEDSWQIEAEVYGADTPYLIPAWGEEDDDYWKRAYETAIELKKLSPAKRRKRHATVRMQAMEALIDGEAIAQQNNVQLPYWAKNAISESRATK